MSFYVSLTGLRNAQTDLGTIAHNIANAETDGFKKGKTIFGDIVAGSTYTNPKLISGIGSTVEAIEQNFSLGSIEQTGASLDVAIIGGGFFTTRNGTSGDTLYTRNGHFSVDQTGFIQDGSNNRLQSYAVDANGNATGTELRDTQIPLTNNEAEFAGITIGESGNITASYADGSQLILGKVALASFVAPTGLRQVGSANWQTTGISGAAKYGQAGEGLYGGLQSGSLERSNVDLAEELVGLITAQRNFQANAKAIDTASQISQTIINLRT